MEEGYRDAKQMRATAHEDLQVLADPLEHKQSESGEGGACRRR